MPMKPPSRRAVLTGSAAAITGLATARGATAGTTDGDSFAYEIQRSEAEWRERLTDDEYYILRDFGTERRRSHPYWEETREGTYHCKGCGLTLYESVYKRVLDIGWVFFYQSCPDTILMSVDGDDPYGTAMGDVDVTDAIIEVHCRRCGSHMGHLLYVPPGEAAMHCINGTALVFEPAEA